MEISKVVYNGTEYEIRDKVASALVKSLLDKVNELEARPTKLQIIEVE